MIDIHCHILPGLDDGPSTLDETLEMCRSSVEDGITGIIATPHLFNDLFYTNREMILKKYAEAREALFTHDIPVSLYVGADMRLIPDLREKIRTEQGLTLNQGKYYLLEFPSQILPPNLNEIVENLLSDDLVPIITHPERNTNILRREQILLDLLEQGALCQITSMSLTGEFGHKCQDFCQRLIEAGGVHFIASDAHSIGWRSPGLSRAAKLAQEIVGEEGAKQMVKNNPEAVIRGDDIPRARIKKLPKRKRFWVF